MQAIRQYKLIFFYIITEMIPTFFVGVISFISVILMLQMLKITDILLQHDVSLRTMVHLLSYMSISLLPAIFPMSLVFAIVLTYNRLTSDSEIIAMKSLGMNMWPIFFPSLVFGLLMSLASLYLSFEMGPWGNRQKELLESNIQNSKIIAAIEEGTFSGFFNLVVYTNSINKETDELEKVFIYDERDPNSPTTIISEKGKFVSEKSFDSYKAFVRLINGDIHKMSDDGHTKIHFQTYDLQITEPSNKQIRNKSMESLTYSDLRYLLAHTEDPKKMSTYQFEWHKRFALSLACLLFAILGTALGCQTNTRSGKSGGGVISVVAIVVYYLFFIVGTSLAKSGQVFPWLGAWLPIIILMPPSVYMLRQKWN